MQHAISPGSYLQLRSYTLSREALHVIPIGDHGQVPALLRSRRPPAPGLAARGAPLIDVAPCAHLISVFADSKDSKQNAAGEILP